MSFFLSQGQFFSLERDRILYGRGTFLIMFFFSSMNRTRRWSRATFCKDQFASLFFSLPHRQFRTSFAASIFSFSLSRLPYS